MLSHVSCGRGSADGPPAQTETDLLNRTDRPAPMPGEAEVKYLDGDFRVVRPGAFVRCAVTGVAIPLEELRYWSVELQEAYASPEAVLQRHGPGMRGVEIRIVGHSAATRSGEPGIHIHSRMATIPARASPRPGMTSC